jgi:hypothetical protein
MAVEFKQLRSDRERMADLLGMCQPSGITITTEISGLLCLDTIVHELMHRECPAMQHKKVYKVARSIANELWKLGYRRPEVTICLPRK